MSSVSGTSSKSSGVERLGAIFRSCREAKRCALIPFITAGDPSLEASLRIAQALEKAGADILELGIPFSDPVADGPVIQRASERALRQGVSLPDVLRLATEIRKTTRLGIVLFGYYNPILRYGLEKFAHDAAEAGADGVLVTDLIPEEAGEYRNVLRGAGLATVFLAAPTSPDVRLKAIAESSSGFIYTVSRTGVTGSRERVPVGARELVGRVRQFTKLPIALGFGISNAAHVNEVAEFADGAVVGTALVNAIDQAAREGEDSAVRAAGEFVAALRAEE